mmetsp:Transcript_2630/g.10497  ORF Transcript_2630/g.10497 Transcript_2630/m.10497 type:complete len:228 (-) Transcript_2630:1983-2666(-)
MRGREIVMVMDVPTPYSLSSSRVPPSVSIMRFASGKPRPVPLWLEEPVRTRPNSSITMDRSSGRMPQPVSVTVNESKTRSSSFAGPSADEPPHSHVEVRMPPPTGMVAAALVVDVETTSPPASAPSCLAGASLRSGAVSSAAVESSVATLALVVGSAMAALPTPSLAPLPLRLAPGAHSSIRQERKMPPWSVNLVALLIRLTMICISHDLQLQTYSSSRWGTFVVSS